MILVWHVAGAQMCLPGRNLKNINTLYWIIGWTKENTKIQTISYLLIIPTINNALFHLCLKLLVLSLDLLAASPLNTLLKSLDSGHNTGVINVQRNTLGGQKLHQNITNHLPANHQQDGWGKGGISVAICIHDIYGNLEGGAFYFTSNFNGSGVMQE